MQGLQMHRNRPSAKPQVFYGYSYRSGGMRMMDIDEYCDSLRDGYTQIQRISGQMYDPMDGSMQMRSVYPKGRRHTHCDCGCDCGCDYTCHDKCCGYDSCCDCCICDADVVIQARCSERRSISLTIENDTRRDREITLSVSDFTTASGKDLGWAAALSETKFKLGPCQEKTVQLVVNIDCNAFHGKQPAGASTSKDGSTVLDKDRLPDVDRCEVAYARVAADGCLSRPVLVAVAVLPNHCDSYVARCKCGCC